ncbi:MAG: class I SAM-dependent methyltransferase [Microvirga sp.]|nr:class I SAM-dependent methyltransferase [Microvirga sp.]
MDAQSDTATTGAARTSRPCPSCGTDHDAAGDGVVLERDGWSVVRCRSCGFVYMPEFAPAEAFVDDLAWEKQFAREAKARLRRMPILQRIENVTRWRHRILPRARPETLARARVTGGAMLDIGCGTGSHALPFTPDFTPYGIEISRNLAREANEAFAAHGGRCEHAESRVGLARFPEGFFSVAVLRSYLEHEAYPNDVLAGLFRVIREGGVAIVKVPNFGTINRLVMGSRWCGYRVPDHVNYFTRRSLADMAKRHGFRIEYPFPWSLPTDDNMWAVLRR